MQKLTKRRVDAAMPAESDYFIWDGALPGLGVRVWPTGRKTFVFKYQRGGRGGPSRRLAIGDHGGVSVENARKHAAQLRAAVLEGRDPATERRAQNDAIRAEHQAPTVAQVVADFLADRRAKKKMGTVVEYQRMLERDVLPKLGKLKVAEVSGQRIHRMHLSMADRPYMANRVLAVLGAMFRFAEQHGYRPPGTNPCLGIEPYREEARERYLTQAEYAAVGAVLMRAEREGIPPAPSRRKKPGDPAKQKHRPKDAGKPIPADPFGVACIRFLMLAGWREGEATSLRWDAVDFERGTATLATTKTGRSIRHLGAPALNLLAGLPRIAGSAYCFPGAKPGAHLTSVRRLWEAVRHAAELPDVRLHDLRHAHASIAAGGGLSLPVIGALLGHREVATTQRYAHLADHPLRTAADQVANAVAAMMSADSDQPATVLPFTRRTAGA